VSTAALLNFPCGEMEASKEQEEARGAQAVNAGDGRRRSAPRERGPTAADSGG